MKATVNYGLPIYEPNDVTSYLTTYNDTMVKIDDDLHQVETQATETAQDLAGVENTVESHTQELTELSDNVSNNTENIAGHGAQISALNQRIDAQDNRLLTIEGELAGVGEVYRGVLSAGEETIAITIGKFNADSLVDIYAETYGVAPLTVELREATGGQPNLCVMTFDPLEADLRLAVVVRTQAEN